MKKAPQPTNQPDDCRQLIFNDFDLPELALDLPEFDIPECIAYEAPPIPLVDCSIYESNI